MCKPIDHLNDIKLGRLMAIIGRMQATRADQIMDRIGLFRGQAMVLMTLARHDGLTHSEIAEKLEISPAAVTKVLKRLEGLNYLQRRPDPQDERCSRAFLLDEGRAVTQQIKQTFAQIDEVLLDGFSAQEQQTLLALLQRVYANLLKQTKETNFDR